MADIKTNFLVTLVFDENTDIRKQVDTERMVKSHIRNGLQRAIVGKKIKHFVIADDEVINDKLKEERKVGKWIKTGGSFRCSECMNMPEFKDIRTLKYCPNCGADMRGSENG